MLLAKRIMKYYLAFYAICVYDIEVLAILHATTLTSAIYVYLPYIVYPSPLSPSPALIELYKLSLPLFLCNMHPRDHSVRTTHRQTHLECPRGVTTPVCTHWIACIMYISVTKIQKKSREKKRSLFALNLLIKKHIYISTSSSSAPRMFRLYPAISLYCVPPFESPPPLYLITL